MNTYGSVELITIGFTTPAPPREVIDAVAAIASGGAVELLDVVIVIRDDDDTVSVIEFDELDDGSELAALEFGAAGLLAEEDAQLIAQTLAPGSSALVLAIEQSWERALLAAVESSNAVVVAEQIIPSPIVQQTIDAAGIANEQED